MNTSIYYELNCDLDEVCMLSLLTKEMEQNKDIYIQKKREKKYVKYD